MIILYLFLILILISAGLFLFCYFLFRPAAILYALALAVSFISVNINIGFTIYASRVLFVILMVVVMLRLFMNSKSEIKFRIDSVFIILFSLIIFIQLLSLPLVENVVEHARHIFIYLSMMAIFVGVLMLGSSITVLVKALRFYLGFGIVQGLVGIYQVIGALRGWPMYQEFIYGSYIDTIKTGNPRNLMGVFYSGLGEFFLCLGQPGIYSNEFAI